MYEKTRLLDSFCYFCESLHGIMDERRKIEEPVSAEFERFNKDFEASLRSETTRLQSAIDVILNSTGKHVRPLLVKVDFFVIMLVYRHRSRNGTDDEDNR